jgi:hypothetical protein
VRNKNHATTNFQLCSFDNFVGRNCDRFGPVLFKSNRRNRVGLKNASSHFLTFYVDGVNKGGVPSGDRSVDFLVTPGEHRLRAEAIINGEVVSANRVASVPAGHVCTWTVTDPPKAAANTTARNAPIELSDWLKPARVYITITNPN